MWALAVAQAAQACYNVGRIRKREGEDMMNWAERERVITRGCSGRWLDYMRDLWREFRRHYPKDAARDDFAWRFERWLDAGSPTGIPMGGGDRIIFS